MTEMQSAAVAAYIRHPSQAVQIARGTNLEMRSRTWPGARIAIHADLAGVETLWRSFEARASCTSFQRFDYLATWFRHVGARGRVTPAVVVVFSPDAVHAIFPLAVSHDRLFRRLTWLGQDLCDYLNPLVAADIAELEPNRFRALWQEIRSLLQSHPRFRHDWVDFRRMPAQVDGTANPMLALPTARHASNAYTTTLTADWETFYRERRPAKARKQDRSKRARLAEFGEVSLVSPKRPADIARMLETLFAQKSAALDRKGIADMFAQPGYREFFLDLATNPRTQDFVHVSALAVGPSLAAINLGLEFRRRYSLFLVSYDRSFARLSPGVIHLNKLMQRAIARDMTEFDFLVGEQRLKREWMDREIPLYDHISAATLRGYCRAAPARAFAHAKRRIKQTPAFWSAFRALRSAFAALRRHPRA